MAPIKPHWAQPSHPAVQEVIVDETEFRTKSLSKVSLPPFAVFAKFTFPPCTYVETPTYATVQIGKDRHMDLNSDLLYINHSCEPSLIFDCASFNVFVGPGGLVPGQELTFFYPSTEWDMAQPFDCLCGTSTCRGRIAGAKDMTAAQLEGLWLNGHIVELLEEREAVKSTNGSTKNGYNAANGNGHALSNGHGSSKSLAESHKNDATVKALKDALFQAEKTVEASRSALRSYLASLEGQGEARLNAHPEPQELLITAGAPRNGPSSRELGGEMGGDTMAIC